VKGPVKVQNDFLRIQDGQIIVDQAQLTAYAIAALVILVLVAVITIVAKTRKKSFIKTVPTNLKRGG